MNIGIMNASIGSKPRVSFEFEVEKVIGISSDGSYQVQWAPTWVNKFQLVGCQHLVDEFLRRQQSQGNEPEPETQRETSDDVVVNHVNGREKQFVPRQSELEKQCPTRPSPLNTGSAEEVGTEGSYTCSGAQKLPNKGVGIKGDLLNQSSSIGSCFEHNHNITSVDQNDDSRLMMDVRERCIENDDGSCVTIIKIEQEQLASSCGNVQNMLLETTENYSEYPVSGGNKESYISGIGTGDSSFSVEAVDITNTQEDDPDSNKLGSTCCICQKHFTFQSAFKRHMLTHGYEKMYECPQCTMTFSRKDSLTVHIRTHTNERPYSCSHCSCSFAHKSSLRSHLLIHEGLKPHTCNVCEKSFTRKGDLVVHMRSHTGEKPFGCEMCGKSFIKSSHLKRHKQSCSGQVN